MMEIPKLGLGTFGRTGEAGMAAILNALEIGYRHIDTAQSYDTEAGVGEAVRRSGVPRSELSSPPRSRTHGSTSRSSWTASNAASRRSGSVRSTFC